MKRRTSLRWFVATLVLTVGLVLVIGYSKLAGYYFISGMDNIIASQMEQTALKYFQAGSKGEREMLRRLSDTNITRHWQEQPVPIREIFGTEALQAGRLYKALKKSGWSSPPETVSFVMLFQQGENRLFVSRQLSRAMVTELVRRNVQESRSTLIMISLGSALALGLLVWLTLRRVSKPVRALSQWTRTLDAGKLDQPPPDFHYPELNDMAGLIRTSLSSVQQALAREHDFLRHASHELRTPICVVRNNVELIDKLRSLPGQTLSPTEQNAFERIKHAGTTMQHLTETLLWLSRDGIPDSLPLTELDLDKLLADLVEENSYLLQGKNINLRVETAPCLQTLPEQPVRIVLGNLIRNAFQHTWEGEIAILQTENEITVINSQTDTTDPADNQGFGMGLRLTRELTGKLGWPYVDEWRDGLRHAVVSVIPHGNKSQAESTDCQGL